MAFQRPTLQEIADRVQADFVSRLELVGAVLRRSVVNVLARVIAGAAHMMHGHLDFLSLQLFPDKSEGPYLLRQAALFGISPKPAAFAIGLTVPLVGVNGSIVPIHSVLQRSDGVEFETDAEVVIAGGVAAPTITALVAGEAGNADAGVVLTFESPIAGVNAQVTVGGDGLVDGSDEETIDELRARFIARLQQPPNGGSAADWVAWTLQVAGVTRAWVYPLELGAGAVTVRFVRDDDVDLIPDAGEVAAVLAYLNTVRPVTAVVTVLAPIAAPVAFTIALTPNNSDTRAAATAELDAIIKADAEPGSTLLLSHLRDAVGAADGVTNYVMTAPAADVANATGFLSTRGVITFV